MKRQTTGWKKIFAKQIFNKGVVSIIYKELLQLNNRITNPFFYRPKDLKRHFTKEDIQWQTTPPKKNTKRCTMPLVIK